MSSIQPMSSDQVRYSSPSLFLGWYGDNSYGAPAGDVGRLTVDEYQAAAPSQKAQYEKLDARLKAAFIAEHDTNDDQCMSYAVGAGSVAAGLTLGVATAGILKLAGAVSSFWPPFLIILGIGAAFGAIWMLVQYIRHESAKSELDESVKQIDDFERTMRAQRPVAKVPSAGPALAIAAPKRAGVKLTA